MSRAFTELEIFSGPDKITYEGRFLGLIRDDEFNALINPKNSREISARIESKETLPIVRTFQIHPEVIGLRFIMSYKKKNGLSVTGKRLFISDRLELVFEISPCEKLVKMTTESGEDLFLKETV